MLFPAPLLLYMQGPCPEVPVTLVYPGNSLRPQFTLSFSEVFHYHPHPQLINPLLFFSSRNPHPV